MPYITADNASELGRKSGEARRNKPVSFLVPVPNNHTIIKPEIARTVAELLKIVSEQIARTRELLNEEPQPQPCLCKKCGKECGHEFSMEPNHRAQLLKALDNLIERKTVLLGIPGPGNLKPTNKPQSQRRAMPEPVPCGPEPTISSVPTVSNEPSSPKSLEPQQ